MAQVSRYKSQRKPKSPPLVPIRFVRLAAGLTLDGLASRMKQATGRQYGTGTISAVESGKRGASPELLEALEAGLALPAGAITIDYTPRAPRGLSAEGNA